MQSINTNLKALIPGIPVLTVVLGAVAASVATGVRAETPQLIDETRGFYAGAGIGRSDYQDGCSTPGAVTTSCDTRDTAWKAYGGYQLNKWLSGEVGYVEFGNATYGGTFGGAPFTGKTETWGISAEAVGQFPIPVDNSWLNKISILGKIGTMYWDQKLSTSGLAPSGSDTGWGLAWGAGLQYTFNEHIGVRAEWEQFNNVGTAATGGESNIQMWTVSVNYKF
jgi:OmpA-OmpF porin, OOP family